MFLLLFLLLLLSTGLAVWVVLVLVLVLGPLLDVVLTSVKMLQQRSRTRGHDRRFPAVVWKGLGLQLLSRSFMRVSMPPLRRGRH